MIRRALRWVLEENDRIRLRRERRMFSTLARRKKGRVERARATENGPTYEVRNGAIVRRKDAPK